MSKSANNKGRQYTKGKGARKEKEVKKRVHAKSERKKSSYHIGGIGSRGGPGSRGSIRTYDTPEKIEELRRHRDEFIHRKFVLKEEGLTVALFLVDKPHSAGTFCQLVTEDPSRRRALPTLDNVNKESTLQSQGLERVISVAEEDEFIQKHKHLDATKKTAGRQEVTAESNPLAFAFAKKFPHLSAKKRKQKLSKIRAKILKLQEKESGVAAAAAALPPPVLNDVDSDWA